MGSINKIVIRNMFFISVVFMMIFCGSSESNAPGTDKKLAMERVACHEDSWVEKVERTKDKIFASSTLKSGKYDYKVQNLFDGKKETCWCPEGDGIGEFIIIKIPYGVKGIRVINGLAANDNLFKNNNRVKEIYVGVISELYYPQKGMEEYDVCGKRKYELVNFTYYYYRIILQDVQNKQEILFDVKDHKGKSINVWNLEGLKRSKVLYLVIGIDSIYKGNKYNDTCISEIEIIK